MVDTGRAAFFQVVIDWQIYQDNQAAIDTIWDSLQARYWCLGRQLLPDYGSEPVMVWLIPDSEWHRVENQLLYDIALHATNLAE